MAVRLIMDVPQDNAARTLSWVLRGFFCSICECYVIDSVRRPEAYNLCLAMIDSATGITDEEKQKLSEEIEVMNREIFPSKE